MHYEEIKERTIPQIEAILDKLDKHIGLKLGIPWEVGGVAPASPSGDQKGRAPKLSELAAFCGEFRGVGN